MVNTPAARARASAVAPGTTSENFTILGGTSEIQRLIIGRAVTGLDVR